MMYEGRRRHFQCNQIKQALEEQDDEERGEEWTSKSRISDSIKVGMDFLTSRYMKHSFSLFL